MSAFSAVNRQSVRRNAGSLSERGRARVAQYHLHRIFTQGPVTVHILQRKPKPMDVRASTSLSTGKGEKRASRLQSQIVMRSCSDRGIRKCISTGSITQCQRITWKCSTSLHGFGVWVTDAKSGKHGSPYKVLRSKRKYIALR